MTYNSGIKARNDYYATIAFAKETAKLEGFREGFQEGFQEGFEEGILQERALFVTKMKNKGLSLEQIAKITKLSLDAISKLVP